MRDRDPADEPVIDIDEPAMEEMPVDAAKIRRVFRRSRVRAEAVSGDSEKLQKIAEKSSGSATARGQRLGAVMGDFQTLVRLVLAYARKDYRDVPIDVLVTIVACLIYVASPVDAIPDVLPGGLIDDAIVIAWTIRTVQSELDRFRAWEAQQGSTPSSDSEV